MSPNPLTNFFETVSFKLKLVLGIAFILLVIVLFFVLLYMPQTTKIHDLQGQIVTMDQQLASLRINTKKIKDIKEKIKELDEEFMKIASVLPTQKEIPDLLKHISSSGRMSGLEFLSFKPGAETKLEHVVEIPVNIQVRGTFFETADFFYKLSRLSRVVNIHNFNIGKAVPQERGYVLTTSFSAKTFRLLSEAEKKQLEEEKKKKKKIKK